MNKKIFFLLTALILPVLVFVFLKFFGKNEFSVEPLFQIGATKPPSGCANVKIPYFISDSAYFLIKRGFVKDSLLIIFYESMSNDVNASDVQLNRLKESYALGTEVSLKRVSGVEKWLECNLLLQAPLDLVLVDGKKRIRGQYTSNERDDVDRLMTELDIILKKY